MRNDVSGLSVVTGAIVTPEKPITRKKNDMKSLVTSPSINDPIPNPDINVLGTKKYQSLPPQLAKFCPGYK